MMIKFTLYLILTVFSIICIAYVSTIRLICVFLIDPNWYNWWYSVWYSAGSPSKLRFWSWVSHLFLLQWYIFRQRIQYGGCCGMYFRVHSKRHMLSCSEYYGNGFWAQLVHELFTLAESYSCVNHYTISTRSWHPVTEEMDR